MTKKQKKQFIDLLVKNELILQDDNSSLDSKRQAESTIMMICSQIMSNANGFDLMNEIDELVQKKLSKE